MNSLDPRPRSLKAAFCQKALPLFLAFIFVVTAVWIDVRSAQAQDCSDDNWSVSSEVELNIAIGCFNGKTAVNSYTISLSQNISLTTSSTAVNNSIAGVSLVVEGSGYTVDGQGIDGVRPFEIAANTTVTMQNITITGGNMTSGGNDGGGIYNAGTLMVSSSTISGNSADYFGGGIFSDGTLMVSSSTVSDNSSDHFGGGISNRDGTLTIISSTLSGNSVGFSGAGIFNNVGTVTVSSSTLFGNSAWDSVGGILNDRGTLTVSNSTISGNLAGANMGGIFNSGTLTVSNSTVSGNSAAGNGGGIYNVDTLMVGNSTLSGNSAGEWGGGILNEGGTVTVRSSTLSSNAADDGGGIRNFSGGTVTVSNSIIANSPAGGDCANSAGTVTDDGHNIVEDNSCGFSGGSDPMLGVLADNGGATQTHALLPGSPAIDAGDTPLTTDQRGIARPQGAGDDIGAFESRGFELLVTGGTPQETLLNTAFATPLALTVSSSYGEPGGRGHGHIRGAEQRG